MRAECFESPGKQKDIKIDVENQEKSENLIDHLIARRIICSYRIARAMTFEVLQKNSLQNENLIYKGLICAVDMHREAMKLVRITIII